jgi:hypothetical protein
MADIFISYAKPDRTIVAALSDELKRQGYTVWYDENLRPGQLWRRVIKTEIEQCRALIAVWTEESAKSQFVLDEVDKANTLEKLVIPARKWDFSQERIPLGLGEVQSCVVSDYATILAALRDGGVVPTAGRGAQQLTAQQIFRSAMPELTLIDRTNTPEGIKASKALAIPNQCLRLCGPTRSGKTVLINQVLGDKNFFSLSGGVIKDLASFHDYLAAQLEPPLENAKEATVITRVLKSGRPIVIDDYHRIAAATRYALIKRLQTFLDANIPVVLVSWTDVDGQRIEADPGIGGRSDVVHMTFWKESDIARIGRVGFEKGLNVELDTDTLSAIARQSFRNPSLMQQYCYEVANACDVMERQATRRRISLPPQRLTKIFEAACVQTKRNFEGWIDRSTDEKFTLVTGSRTSMFGLILLAVAKMEPIHAMSTPRLARKMRALVDNNEWITGPIAENAVRDFMARLEGNAHRHTAIDFADGKIHIHPFFKRYILWSFAPSMGFPPPDLTGYSDETS